jgi:adenylate cyclase
MDWINEYLEALARQVQRHSGVIDKYMGDAIMAVFGFSLALTAKADIHKDACNAVSCALDMGAELRRLNDAWQARGRAPVQVRIGICSGPTVASCIGTSDRLEFTMIGDTVNVTERLESFDKDYAPNRSVPNPNRRGNPRSAGREIYYGVCAKD